MDGTTTLLEYQQRFNLLAKQCEEHQFTEQAERIRQKACDCNEKLLIMIVGEGKFGKSSLINALYGSEVAPVSRLPKTWKIDIYESIERDDSCAYLYYKSAPDQSIQRSIADALAICDQEEQKMLKNSADDFAWKSDLYQVRWCVKVPWCNPRIALVDTPGFSQFRSGDHYQAFNLYGSDGIQWVCADTLSYYYHRSDIVLWCVRADKLGDQDTLSALKNSANEGKEIIGVLTHIDKMPEARRNEALDQARKIHAPYISEFIPFSASTRHADLKARCVNNLRKQLTDRYIMKAEKIKEKAIHDSYNKELKQFAGFLSTIIDVYRDNVTLWFQKFADARQRLMVLQEKALAAATAVWDDAQAKGIGQLDSLYAACNENVALFSELVKNKALDTGRIQQDSTNTLTSLNYETKRLFTWMMESLTWQIVTLGPHSTLQQYRQAQLVKISDAYCELSGNYSPALSSDEGSGEGAIVGLGAAAVGLAVFGPIGLALGVLGYYASKVAKRNNCINKATGQISHYCTTNKEQLKQIIQAKIQHDIEYFRSTLESAFIAHHNRNFAQVISHAWLADQSLNVLGYWPPDRPRVKNLIPSYWEKLDSMPYSYGFLQFLDDKKPLWDQSVPAAINSTVDIVCSTFITEFSNAANAWKERCHSVMLHPHNQAFYSFENDSDLQPFLNLTDKTITAHLKKIMQNLPVVLYADGRSAVPQILEPACMRVKAIYQQRLRELQQTQNNLARQWNDNIDTFFSEPSSSLLRNCIGDFENVVEAWIAAQEQRYTHVHVVGQRFTSYEEIPTISSYLNVNHQEMDKQIATTFHAFRNYYYADGTDAVDYWTDQTIQSKNRAYRSLRKRLSTSLTKIQHQWNQAVEDVRNHLLELGVSAALGDLRFKVQTWTQAIQSQLVQPEGQRFSSFFEADESHRQYTRQTWSHVPAVDGYCATLPNLFYADGVSALKSFRRDLVRVIRKQYATLVDDLEQSEQVFRTQWDREIELRKAQFLQSLLQPVADNHQSALEAWQQQQQTAIDILVEQTYCRYQENQCIVALLKKKHEHWFEELNLVEATIPSLYLVNGDDAIADWRQPVLERLEGLHHAFKFQLSKTQSKLYTAWRQALEKHETMLIEEYQGLAEQILAKAKRELETFQISGNYQAYLQAISTEYNLLRKKILRQDNRFKVSRSNGSDYGSGLRVQVVTMIQESNKSFSSSAAGWWDDTLEGSIKNKIAEISKWFERQTENHLNVGPKTLKTCRSKQYNSGLENLTKFHAFLTRYSNASAFEASVHPYESAAFTNGIGYRERFKAEFNPLHTSWIRKLSRYFSKTAQSWNRLVLLQHVEQIKANLVAAVSPATMDNFNTAEFQSTLNLLRRCSTSAPEYEQALIEILIRYTNLDFLKNLTITQSLSSILSAYPFYKLTDHSQSLERLGRSATKKLESMLEQSLAYELKSRSGLTRAARLTIVYAASSVLAAATNGDVSLATEVNTMTMVTLASSLPLAYGMFRVFLPASKPKLSRRNLISLVQKVGRFLNDELIPSCIEDLQSIMKE